MSLSPTALERLNRARADLRMGLPVALVHGGKGALAVAAEGLQPDRLAALRDLGAPVVVLTAHRAQTLKARVYDGDLTRITLPNDADTRWVRALADPAGDLANPMKGPLTSQRNGPADLHRAAIRLAK